MPGCRTLPVTSTTNCRSAPPDEPPDEPPNGPPDGPLASVEEVDEDAGDGTADECRSAAAPRPWWWPGPVAPRSTGGARPGPGRPAQKGGGGSATATISTNARAASARGSIPHR